MNLTRIFGFFAVLVAALALTAGTASASNDECVEGWGGDCVVVNDAPTPEPAPTTTVAPTPTTEAPAPTPTVAPTTTAAPAPVPTTAAPAPVVEAPAPAPVTRVVAPAPVVEAPAPAPVVEAPAPVAAVVEVEPCFAIGNYVWLDANEDGIQDDAELGLADVEVTLFAADGTLLESTATDVNGWYAFSCVYADDYTVSVATPEGLAPTAATTGDSCVDSNGIVGDNGIATDITVTGEDTCIDFGFVVNVCDALAFYGDDISAAQVADMIAAGCFDTTNDDPCSCTEGLIEELRAAQADIGDLEDQLLNNADTTNDSSTNVLPLLVGLLVLVIAATFVVTRRNNAVA